MAEANLQTLLAIYLQPKGAQTLRKQLRTNWSSTQHYSKSVLLTPNSEEPNGTLRAPLDL